MQIENKAAVTEKMHSFLLFRAEQGLEVVSKVKYSLHSEVLDIAAPLPYM